MVLCMYIGRYKLHPRYFFVCRVSVRLLRYYVGRYRTLRYLRSPVQALPEDMNHETGLEKVIGQVATFKRPTAATGKGVYELKVPKGGVVDIN